MATASNHDRPALKSAHDRALRKYEAKMLRGNGAKEDQLVEGVVVQLNTLSKRATFDFAMAVGKIVIDSFFGGAFGAWRDRGAKAVSFRKLANHPDLTMSPSALYRSVAIYELAQRLGIDGERHVSISHLRVVLPLPNDEQARLLRLTEAHSWPVSRLEQETASLSRRGERNRRGGRRARSPLRKVIAALEHCIDESERALETEGIDITQETAESVVEQLRRLQRACGLLEARLIRGLAGH
jgi:hypothetical protein